MPTILPHPTLSSPPLNPFSLPPSLLPSLAGENVLNSGCNKNVLYSEELHVIMRKDCKLVLYNLSHPIWESPKSSPAAENCHCSLLCDGTLVVLNRYGAV
ncbi:hypothetical protein AMTRI_Chr08g161210 [Amborella trichopoda]